MDKKKCKNCIWYDQCGEEKVCDYYEPVSEEEQDEIKENEYIQDVRERHYIYNEQVKEQNS